MSKPASGLALGLLVLGLLGLGCDPRSESTNTEARPPHAYDGAGPIRVVTTVGMLTDITRRIGGPRVEVTGLMGPGTDPHLYKSSPGDVKRLSRADLVLYGGHHLEGKMGDVFERISRRIPTVAVSERIPRDRLLAEPDSADAIDPHSWFDVALWRDVAAVVRDELSAFDPAEKAGYQARATPLLAELVELDAWVRRTLDEVPETRRVLITAHDAFRYFGRAYDLEVVGIQGLSTESEASVQKINDLVSFIVERGVKAVFVESTVSEKNIRALVEGCASRGHPLVIGGSLYSDAMGAEGTPSGTYTGMIRHNVRTIVEALR